VPSLQLRYASGPRRDQTLIFSGPRVRIGRSRDNDVALPETESPRASAHHAEAVLEGRGWWIVDLGSTNGTLLNGAAVRRAALRTGDRLSFGDHDLLVEIGGRRAVWIAVAAIAALAIAASVLVLVRQRRSSPFETVAQSAPQSVYLLAVEDRGRRTVTATAFAVDGADALLATNAHVVDALKGRTSDAATGPRPVAIMSDRDTAVALGRTWVHPEWRRGSVAYDVGLVELAGHPPTTPLRLGDSRSVERLRRGAALATFGFPAVSTDPLRPRGRLALDVVGDVRLPYIEVGLLIAPGTSGSPVFDENGVVVGMVVGGDFVNAGDGRGRSPSGSGVNWMIAITALRELLEMPR
jgi:pSer/pThr/pTyr-binding forkhead associated (FHA) protein